jgi:C1A family cysteine protease
MKSSLKMKESPLQTHVNWTAYGLVHEVLDQGMCGGYYAFARVGVLEAVALKKNNHTKFSSIVINQHLGVEVEIQWQL